MSFLTYENILAFLLGMGAVLLLGCLPMLRRIRHMRTENDRLERDNAVLHATQQLAEQNRATMRVEFQQLAQQVLDEKGQTFSRNSQLAMDTMLQPLREQIHGFQKRVNDIHDSSVRSQAELGAEIRRVLETGMRMSAEASNLAMALKGDNKAVGNWGEVQLERSLQIAGLLAGEHYQAQAGLRAGTGDLRQPDFVIHLPDGKHLIIDSKVSLLDYGRAVAAGDENSRQAALAAHVKAVRRHIRDLAGKDYSNLIGIRSPDFVLMFMSVEPAYIEAMRHDPELFDHGYAQNVILVSHTTLMPVLRTVANLWLLERSSEQARELGSLAGGLYEQVSRVAERLQKLGNSLQAVKTHFNQTVTAVSGQQGLYGKVERFADFSAKVKSGLPKLQPVHADIDVERLQAAIAPEGSNGNPEASTSPRARSGPGAHESEAGST